MGARQATAEERSANEIPESDEAIVVTGQIRRRDSQPLMEGAWGELEGQGS